MTTASTAGSWIASSGSADARSARASSRPARRGVGARVRDDDDPGVGDGGDVAEVGLAHPPGAEDRDADRVRVPRPEGHSRSRRWSARLCSYRSRASCTLSWPLTSATGTSHQPSMPGTRPAGDVGTTTTVGRSRPRAPASAARISSGRSRVHRDGAHRLGVLPEVDGDVVAGQPTGDRIAEPQLVAEVADAAVAREVEDALVAVVVEHDDGQRQPFGDRRDDLGVEHQVRAVPDHDDDVALWIRELHAEPRGDLVAHARVAVLEVVRLGVLGAPQLQEVARQAARARRSPSRARRRRR